MQNPEAQKLIKETVDYIEKNGLVLDVLIDQLKRLRPFALEENDPLVTKVLRLAYEHLEKYESFHIDNLDDEEVESAVELSPYDRMKANIEYFIQLCGDAQNKYNREELAVYRDLLNAYESVGY